MASDFFYPNTGGVEAHIWQLGQCLVELGHKVIVITHAYGDRIGIRYMPNTIKVYYLPFRLYPNQNVIWPLLFHSFSPVREILISEQINIVHGHSAFSPLAHEVMFHAKTLNINTVFTDHSLFGLNDFGAMIHNHFVRFSLIQCNHIICVSHVGMKNEALHLEVEANKRIPVSVIPNAVDTSMFTPDPCQRDPNRITIIVNSRLVYRKGIDLLADVLPRICSLNPKVHFIIAGDGPKRALLEAAVEQHQLHDRVQLLGSIPHDQVRDVLVKGDIFLNTSRIEAFCMAVVEAASCGLQVVSTNVGGLPKVLPRELIKLTDPTADGLVQGVETALKDLVTNKSVPPNEAHQIIRQRRDYSWKDVACKTESVYKTVMKEPVIDFRNRLYRYYRAGSILSLLFMILAIMDHLLLLFHEWYSPRIRRPGSPCAAIARNNFLSMNGKNNEGGDNANSRSATTTTKQM